MPPGRRVLVYKGLPRVMEQTQSGRWSWREIAGVMDVMVPPEREGEKKRGRKERNGRGRARRHGEGERKRQRDGERVLEREREKERETR